MSMLVKNFAKAKRWSNPRPPSPPRPKPKVRSVSWQCRHNPDGGPIAGKIVIKVDECRVSYALEEIPCDFGARAFEVRKLAASGAVLEIYHVMIDIDDPAGCSCECRGFLSLSRCRHIEALLALLRHEPKTKESKLCG